MIKKIMYLLGITVILLIPIVYWLFHWWGIRTVPSLPTLKYIYAQDQFLKNTTLVNVVLYFFAIVKIMLFTGKKKSVKSEAKKERDTSSKSGGAVQNAPDVDKEKWEKMYGKNAVKQAVKSSPKTNVDDVAEVPEFDTKSMSMETSEKNMTSQEVVKPLENTDSHSNVMDKVQPITAVDVYRNQIANVLEGIGYKSMGSMVLNSVNIDFVAIADSDTLVLGIINSEAGNIVANDNADLGEEPGVWFASEHRYTSPVWQVKTAVNNVEKLISEVLPEDNGVVVKPVVVVPNATISNLSEMQEVWENLGVSVVKFLNPSDLPELTEVVPDKTGTDVLESYQTFVQTLMKYFNRTMQSLGKKS